MGDSIDIRDIASRLLTPNDTLDVTLFDIRGNMYPDVRKVLLDNAKYILLQTVGDIEGIETIDIYLNGSSASYFYYDKSDIDVRIEVHNENCPYISKDTLEFNRFLHTIYSGAMREFKFQYNNRKIDIKLTADTFEIVGLYSILKDEWVIKPDKYITKGLELEDILSEFQKRFDEIDNYLSCFRNMSGGLPPDKQKELAEFFSTSIRNNNVSIREYIIYKLLNYTGVFQEMKNILSEGVKAYLTVE